MVLPLFDQGDVFYHGTSQANLNRLQTQNRAVRIISRLPRLKNVEDESKKCYIATLVNRRKRHLAQVARWLAGSESYRDQIEAGTRSHASNRRKLKVPFPGKQTVRRSFLYQATTLLNDHISPLREEPEGIQEITLVTGSWVVCSYWYWVECSCWYRYCRKNAVNTHKGKYFVWWSATVIYISTIP